MTRRNQMYRLRLLHIVAHMIYQQRKLFVIDQK